MKTPNPEQKLAIEHCGGVLLSAGAGSGKTFVLVEHLIYLIRTFYDEQPSEIQHSNDQLIRKLRTYLSSLVFMTFTKKAAGELSLRMKNRVQEQAEFEPQLPLWNLVQDALPSLTVSTIHGFCFKLLGGGYFPELEPQPLIISELEAAQRLNTLMREWFETQKAESREGIDILLANSDSVLKALSGIFGSSELRSAWKDFKPENLNSWESFWKELIVLNDWRELFQPTFSLESFAGILNDKQKDYLKDFDNLCRLQPLSHEAHFESYIKYAKIRSPQFRKKEELGSLADYLELLKDFREFVKKNEEDLLAFIQHKEGAFLSWPKLFKELFDYCDENYRRFPGFTFSDLEYFVLRGLQNKESCLRVAKDYRYFIIDEFQDTSPGQYDIVRLILENDLSRLFVVGDVKHAIYGFRGGELGFFRHCQSEIPKLLSLKNNYRSTVNVINFNNELFADLFSRGLDFEGHDPFSVVVEKQNIPTEFKVEEGKVSKLIANLKVELADEELEKFSLKSGESAKVEAQILFDKIQKIRETTPQEKICILYKKLAPARELVSLFLKHQFSFSAQMKVQQGEDPLLSIFTILLEHLLSKTKNENETKSLEHLEMIIASHFNLMGFSLPQNWKEELVEFYANIPLLGIATAYRKWFMVLGLSNSNFENNMALIDILCQVGRESVDRIVTLLNESEKSYSLDFKSGHDSSKLVMMTAHASKGLEFEHVFVAGIHANHRSKNDDTYVGKFPGSFKWKADISQKSPFKSPEFILEKLITQRKNFSESKRLFYVATTRAKKALYYADIRIVGRGLSDLKMDWINGFRKFEEETLFLQEDLFQKFKANSEDFEVPYEIQEESKVLNPGQLFHYDTVGLAAPSLASELAYAISGELSVTRLASICDCPRKFYLKNVCRFSDDELALLKVPTVFEEDEKTHFEERALEDGPVSSMKRGSHIHLLISQMIKSGGEISDDLSVAEKKMLTWLKEQFPKEGQFVSEEAIKFPLNGLMISGTPDLAILNKAEEFSIWDFKTGKRHPEKEDSYWFQVYCYGHAFFESLGRDRTNLADKRMSFVLAYVDQQKIVVEQKNHLELKEALFPVLKKLAHLTQTNLEHCARCPFAVLCQA